MDSADFRKFEQLIADIQSQLSPTSEVLHNHFILGVQSGVMRQIDVFVRGRVGQYEINIAIECKDHKRRIDIKKVEEFAGLLADVQCQQGVLVSPHGFTKAAKERARRLGIQLYRPIDTREHKWKTRVWVPAVFEFSELAVSFCIECSAPVPFTMYPDFFANSEIYNAEGTLLGTPVEKVVLDWNDARISLDKAQLLDRPIFDQREVFCDNGYGMRIPVGLTVDLYVTTKLFVGALEVDRISGFQDQFQESVITNAFSVGMLTPDEIIDNWRPVESEEGLVPKPVIKLFGRTLFDVSEAKRKTYLS